MSSNPVKDFGEGVGKGATEGLLEYSEKKIKELVDLFKNKELKFIGDKQNIEIAKKIKNSGELSFYKAYIKDKEILFIIKLGLVLRRIEKDQKKLQDLKHKIVRKYGVKGLHIAYFVQNGILNRYVGILLDNLDSPEKLNETIVNTLKNIERHILFVEWKSDERQILKDSMTIIATHTPNIFIVSGIGSAAKTVSNCEEKLVKALNKYELEKMSTGKKEILFFKYKL